ncbi:MAG TPA: hypothetical protein DIT25_03345 [Candidatus Moranbacteria bacterium]|nr:hypothetical protein [Candidatus Moranbacteria bacterium]
MKVLFISHTYPPITGGVETQNYDLSVWLAKQSQIRLIVNKKRWLIPFFLVYSAFKAIFLARNYDVIVLGSCLLGNIGWAVKKFTNKPVVAVAHGLDLTWKNKFYQSLWVGKFIPSLDKLIAVGNETVRIAVEKGIAPEKIVFIPNGIDLQKYPGSSSKGELEKLIGEEIGNKKTILTSGRLAKRKGVAWFIDNVMPKLPDQVIYIVAGDGPDRENIQEAILKNNLEKRVKLLGYVTDPVRDMLFHTCDVFVQPNIEIAGDTEGFGISVIEAAYCGIPVVAARLEGLQDAIKDGQNGFLIESRDAGSYARKINELLSDDSFRKNFGEKARQYVVENYSWDKISKKYLEEIESAIPKSPNS